MPTGAGAAAAAAAAALPTPFGGGGKVTLFVALDSDRFIVSAARADLAEARAELLRMARPAIRLAFRPTCGPSFWR